jgi:hypothetical protein
MVVESMMSQYCRFNSAGGVVWYVTFRELTRVEAQDCQATKMMGKMTVSLEMKKSTLVIFPFHKIIL